MLGGWPNDYSMRSWLTTTQSGGFLSFAAWLRERYPDARLFSRFTASPLPLPQPQPHSAARSPPITLGSLPRPTLKLSMGFTPHEWGSGCVGQVCAV